MNILNLHVTEDGEPFVSPELLKYLSDTFTVDSMLQTTDPTTLYQIQGQQMVLQHLQALWKRQNPDKE